VATSPKEQVIGKAAYRLWARGFRKTEPGEVCELMRCFFPGAIAGGATTCPPVCPKVGGHPYASSPESNPKYARDTVSESAGIPESNYSLVSTATPSTSENMRAGDEPGVNKDAPIVNAPVAVNTARPAVNTSAPPCEICGEFRPIMVTMAAGVRGHAWRLCSRCYR